MVRGYQKKVVFLKNTGSEIFDEAYFVFADGKESGFYPKDDIIKECERIIEENPCENESVASPKRKLFVFIKKHIASFLTGLALGIGATLLIILL